MLICIRNDIRRCSRCDYLTIIKGKFRFDCFLYLIECILLTTQVCQLFIAGRAEDRGLINVNSSIIYSCGYLSLTGNETGGVHISTTRVKLMHTAIYSNGVSLLIRVDNRANERVDVFKQNISITG